MPINIITCWHFGLNAATTFYALHCLEAIKLICHVLGVAMQKKNNEFKVKLPLSWIFDVFL